MSETPTTEKAARADAQLRHRLAILDPGKATLFVKVADLREVLDRLVTAEAEVERLQFEAKQRLLFEQSSCPASAAQATAAGVASDGGAP